MNETFNLVAGPWLQEHTDLRDRLNEQLDIDILRNLTRELQKRVEDSNRTTPIPKLSDRARLRLEKEGLKRQRIEEQIKEEGRPVTPEVHPCATSCIFPDSPSFRQI